MAVPRRPALVGIDGQSGSGKSTLARELAESLPVSVAIVQGDDFYSDTSADAKALLSPEEGYDSYFDWRRLRSEVLLSVREGATTLRYQRYDWDSAAIGQWTEIPMSEIVIVEGVYTLRPELRDQFDVSAFVRTSESTRLKRQAAREESSDHWITRWKAAEDFYVVREEPWGWVDFLFAGE